MQTAHAVQSLLAVAVLVSVVGCGPAVAVLGAPVIASALMWQGERPSPQVVYQAPPSVTEPARPELPPAEYDPYSGASLRRE